MTVSAATLNTPIEALLDRTAFLEARLQGAGFAAAPAQTLTRRCEAFQIHDPALVTWSDAYGGCLRVYDAALTAEHLAVLTFTIPYSPWKLIGYRVDAVRIGDPTLVASLSATVNRISCTVGAPYIASATTGFGLGIVTNPAGWNVSSGTFGTPISAPAAGELLSVTLNVLGDTGGSENFDLYLLPPTFIFTP